MALPVIGLAQSYAVGERVEYECACFGRSEWVPATIEAVQDGTYRVRYGTRPNQFKDGVRPSYLREPDFAIKNEQRRNFFREASNYRMSVYYLMQVHDTKLLVNGSQAYRPPVREDDWVKLRSDLSALNTLCTTKYAGMKNPGGDATNIDNMPATWCEIAARHKEYEQKGRGFAAADQFTPILKGLLHDIQQNIDNPGEYIDEDIQLLIYEREKWRAARKAKLAPNFAKLGVPMPDDFFKDVEAKGDEMKAINERLAPGRTFLMPKQKDPAVEAFIRGRYATQKKGVQILKLGMDDASWQIHRNSLGIPLSQTKVARLLVKVPNRPFCQEHSVAVERKYTRGALGAMAVEGNVGSEGLFMSCQ